ncbi:hypothetical protein [Microbulbifer epialgicus]|uniref:Uncharacterized protein n=1 Tax=Microbulbifer epialgicus TaxID=393907 RepID=A0ABV4P3X2_9GAMM
MTEDTNKLQEKLETSLGKNISQICGNKFHSPSDNHCAHFVSHILELDFPFNCKNYSGGNSDPANVRVQEIFPKCPKVGKWEDANKEITHLVFVTKIDNVDIARKKIRNVPQKHIGIFNKGYIYHYSNANKRVEKVSPRDFLKEFDRKYSGKQGLFFGTLPEIDLLLNIKPASNIKNKIAFNLEKNGRKWLASEKNDSGNKFYIGHETSKGNYIGLFSKTDEYYGPKYCAKDYYGQYDHWSQIMELIGYCESKNYFNIINTYDSAKFTFGFFQFAAHTPNDNLILLIKSLYDLPKFNDYFPELEMHDGKLYRTKSDGGRTNLEIEMESGPRNRRQLQYFMNYLNAKLRDHDTQEVLQSARLIHWSNNDIEARNLQVDTANNILQKKMQSRYSRWYNLDGEKDVICALVADIHHQGRASKAKVKLALKSKNKIDRLININQNYQGRISDLKNILGRMVDNGQLGKKVYDAGLNEFR